VGTRGGRHDGARQSTINARLIELARAGHRVVRLKGGDPFVFGRGGEELDDLRRAGIDVLIVPGISSAFAAPAALGIPVTKRGVASSVAITTAQGTGSLDRLADLARSADTIVVLMALGELSEVAAVLARAVGGSRPAAVIGNATLPSQRSVTGALDRIARMAADAAIEAPATLVVGDVVAVEQVAGLERIAL
jgi:uroporphyrin-III C-methyltransferase/precorrin-2 dehydrogenase/sirohydrochlorin ferrochelatase